MSRIRVPVILSIAVVGVVALGLTVASTGSGQLGHIGPAWQLLESCTPDVPGDTQGSVGSASFTAGVTSTSRYVADNPVALTHPDSGTFRGRITGANEQGLESSVSVAGGLGFLVANRTMPPIWAQDQNDAQFLIYGSGTGQVGDANDIAVDPVDGSVFVASYSYVNGVDRHKIIKFDADGNYVTEFGSFGTGNGQFGGYTTVAVSPVDQAVWVGDGTNQRIQKFTRTNATTYTYSTKVGANGTGNGQFGSTENIPVAVDSSGNVFAGDRGNDRVQKFNSSATYQAQAATAAGAASPYDVKVYGSLVYASDGLDTQVVEHPGHISIFNTNLIAQPLEYAIPAPSGTTTGIGFFDIDSAGELWAVWFGATYIVKYNSIGVELTRWQSLYPAPITLNDTMVPALSAADIGYVLFRYQGVRYGNPYGSNYVTGFDLRPVPLSGAIERYLQACDPTLNGYTFDYQAAEDPDVVFPGWSGDVWAKIKELCTAYNIQVDLIDDVIVVSDVGTATIQLENNTPVRLTPSSSPTGRAVQIVAQNPVAGGGSMWDSADQDHVYSIDVGGRANVLLTTKNHPVALANPVPTSTLPILPGQYHVVDSAGVAVPAETWATAGGLIAAGVGESPGTVRLEFVGPAGTITGFTGPFYFATGRGPTDVGALSIVGNGVTTAPETVKVLTGANPAATAQEVAFTLNTPFMDTRARAYDRGVWAAAEAAGPNVEIQFDVPVSELSGYGSSVGSMVDHEASRYRVKDVGWGNLTAHITATRRVTLGEVDAAWGGPVLRTNYLPNPSGIVSTTGWSMLGSGTGPNLIPSGTTMLSTAGGVGAGSAGLVSSLTIGAGEYPLLPLTTYTFSADILSYLVAGTVGKRCMMFVSGTGVPISVSNNNAAAPTSYTRRAVTFVTGASGVVNFYVLNGEITAAGTTVVAFNDALVEDGASGTAYFAGSTASGGGLLYKWTGTADNSPSTESVGFTLGEIDAFWDGYSGGDRRIQPLLTTR